MEVKVNPTRSLTRFQPGSVGEIFSVTWPLVLTMMSNHVMLFVDRLFLAWHSLEAMNSASLVLSLVVIFQFGPVALTGISEVFVGQYNGAGKYSRIGAPVWQMIWLSLALALLYVPLGIWGHSLMLAEEHYFHGKKFFQVLMAGSFIIPLNVAISGFYSGLGRVKIVTVTTIASNIFNAALCYVFLFGFEPFFPALGPAGVAWATVIAEGTNALVLLAIFLGKDNRKTYKTSDWKLKPQLFKECVRVGLPASLSHFIEFTGWSVLFTQVAKIDISYLTVHAVSMNLFIITNFLVEGLKAGVVAVASNMIGGGHLKFIKKLLRSAFKLHLVICALAAVPLIIFSMDIIKMFVTDPRILASLAEQLHWAVIFVWLYLVTDGFSWVISGILTAGGDTRFILKVNVFSLWVGAIAPVFYFIVLKKGPPCLIWALCCPYALLNLFFFSWRYTQGKWRKLVLGGVTPPTSTSGRASA